MEPPGREITFSITCRMRRSYELDTYYEHLVNPVLVVWEEMMSKDASRNQKLG